MIAAKSHTAEILHALQAGERLTGLDALDRWGCLRLGARIYDIRHEHGIDVRSERIKTRTGKWVTRYYIPAEPVQGELALEGAETKGGPRC